MSNPLPWETEEPKSEKWEQTKKWMKGGPRPVWMPRTDRVDEKSMDQPNYESMTTEELQKRREAATAFLSKLDVNDPKYVEGNRRYMAIEDELAFRDVEKIFGRRDE